MLNQVKLRFEFTYAIAAAKFPLINLQTHGSFTTIIQLMSLNAILVDDTEAVWAGGVPLGVFP